MTKIFIIFVMLLGFRPLAQAWNAEGHMIVAQIAYNHLGPVAKAKCDSLIATPVQYAGNNNSNFVTAACWPDDIKGSTSAYNIWHYIDLPFSLDGTSTAGVVADTYDVVKAINYNITNLQNSSLSLSNQAVNLRLLIHFVGDIQQPLHCSTAVSSVRTSGDAGGNTFYVTGGTWSNLHSLWDQGGGYLFDSLPRPLSLASQNTLNAKVAMIEADYPYNYTTNISTIPDPMTWAQEGLDAAKNISYVGISLNGSPSTNYLYNANVTTEQRMAQGGHRLADLLNTLYPSPPIILSAVQITNGSIRFSWGAVSNSTYYVQWKQKLADPTWNDLTSIIPPNNSATFTEAITQTQRFYRVTQ